MHLKLNGTDIGTLYCNIQITRKTLTESYSSFIKKLEEGKVTFDYEKVKVTIKSYRKYYANEEYIYIEGSELSFA